VHLNLYGFKLSSSVAVCTSDFAAPLSRDNCVKDFLWDTYKCSLVLPYASSQRMFWICLCSYTFTRNTLFEICPSFSVLWTLRELKHKETDF